MKHIYYQEKGVWTGDCMPFYHDGAFYVYHQRDPRDPEPYPGEHCQPLQWSCARTKDFIEYEDLGDVIERGEANVQDQHIWAGSIFEKDGLFYAIYTGYNQYYYAQGKLPSIPMLATSTDLIHWERTGKGICYPQEGYDVRDWRDPYVFYDEESEEYVLILGTRKIDGKKIRTGAIVYFTSKDFENWEFGGDLWYPKRFEMTEMPDMFKIGDWWYLVYTEYADKTKTRYRMSKSLKGPWIAPVDDAFDGRAFYAARTATNGKERYLFGWVPTKWGEDERNQWQWAGTLVVHEVYQREDGTLGVRIPKTVSEAFQNRKELLDAPLVLESQDALEEAYLTHELKDSFKFESKFKVSEGTRYIELRLFEDAETQDTYQYQLALGEDRLLFDHVPNHGGFIYMNKGLERPIHIDPEKEYTLELIVDGQIPTLYIDGVALNARMYERPGRSMSVSVIDGKLTVSEACITENIK